MSSALALVPPGRSAGRSADRPLPVRAGDTVTVPDPVETPSGRRVPRGRYAVLDAEWTPPEHRHPGPYRLTVEATPDTAPLPRMYHRPTADEQRAGAPVPLAARPGRFFLYPGSFTRYRSGSIETVPDHPLQTD